MYDIIYGMIDHSWTTSASEQSYLYYTCCTLILLLTVVFVDMVYRTFRHFWRS